MARRHRRPHFSLIGLVRGGLAGLIAFADPVVVVSNAVKANALETVPASLTEMYTGFNPSDHSFDLRRARGTFELVGAIIFLIISGKLTRRLGRLLRM